MSHRNVSLRHHAYPSELSPEIRRTLAALADVETRYDSERQRLAHWTGPSPLRVRLLAQIEARHRVARLPLVQRLADLQREMMSALLISRIRVLH